MFKKIKSLFKKEQKIESPARSQEIIKMTRNIGAIGDAGVSSKINNNHEGLETAIFALNDLKKRFKNSNMDYMIEVCDRQLKRINDA